MSTKKNARTAETSHAAQPRLTLDERTTLAGALALALKCGTHAPDIGITDWNDHEQIVSACWDIVDRMPTERARIHLMSIHAALLPEPRTEAQRLAQLLVAGMIEQYFGDETRTAPPIVDVLTTPAIGQVSGMLTAAPKLELRDNGELYTDVDLDEEDPAYDPDRYNRVREVVHLRTHDIVILACERELIVMSSDEFHSQV